MNSKKRFFTTAVAIIGALTLIFVVFQTRKLYFTKTKSEDTPTLQSVRTQPFKVPKLKIFRNEILKAEKPVVSQPENENLEVEGLESDSSQQILTHKYMIKVLSQQQNYLRRCFENHLRSSSTPVEKGTVVVDFMVLPFGEIRDVEIKDSSFDDATFENCIKTVFLRTQVKKFSGEKFLITFPLEFE